jgi:hypothetical protein
VAAGEEHRRVARGASVAVAVGGRVLVVVRLELDDRPAHAVDEQPRADQLGRDLVHVTSQVQRHRA